jgi:hypothetical protein
VRNMFTPFRTCAACGEKLRSLPCSLRAPLSYGPKVTALFRPDSAKKMLSAREKYCRETRSHFHVVFHLCDWGSDHAFLYFARSLLFCVRKIAAQIFSRPMSTSVTEFLFCQTAMKANCGLLPTPTRSWIQLLPVPSATDAGCSKKGFISAGEEPCPGTLGPGVSPIHATAAVLTMLADVGCSVGIRIHLRTAPRFSAPYRRRRASRIVEMLGVESFSLCHEALDS